MSQSPSDSLTTPTREADTIGGWTRDNYAAAALWMMDNGKLPDPAWMASLTPMLALLEFKVTYLKLHLDATPPELPKPLPIYANPAKRWVTLKFKEAYEQLFHVEPRIK